jgi:uncharacterized Fe-S cluster-containing radical SAM superfamily enzyme
VSNNGIPICIRFGSGLDPDSDLIWIPVWIPVWIPIWILNEESTRRALREGAIKFHSRTASNVRRISFGTRRKLYFQLNTSPYIGHDTDTIMTPYDTGGIEIVPDHSMSCKYCIFNTYGPSPRSERLNRRCHFSVRLS